MRSSKIPVQDRKLSMSLIPVRCNKNTADKKNRSQLKSSSQLPVPSESKRHQGVVSSLKSSKISENIVKELNRFPSTNHQATEKNLLKNQNLKTDVNQAKKVPPKPLKLSNRPAKPAPVPVHQRNLPSVNASNKEPKSYNLKKSKAQIQSASQQQSKNQNTSNPLKKTQSTRNGKNLKTDEEPKQSKKDGRKLGNQAGDYHRKVERKPLNAHNIAKITISLVSNKENLDTLTVEEGREITEKQKNKVKKKEDSLKIEAVSQKSEINEEMKFSENTGSEVAQCNEKKKERNLSCSAKNDKVVVNDSEFKNSGFFKSMILSERELSPGIIKLCSESKVSSLEEFSKFPLKKFISSYSSSKDFIEDLRRTSSNHQKRKGNSPIVPGMKSPAKKYLESFSSVNAFVEDFRRNSENLIRRRETIQGSTPLVGNQSSVKKCLGEYSSAQDLVEDLRRNSANFIKTRGKLHFSPYQNTPFSRRWTCNVQSSLVKRFPVVKEEYGYQTHKKPLGKSPINNYLKGFSSVKEIVEDLRRNSTHLVRKETVQSSTYLNVPKNAMNPQLSVLKGSQTAKKKEKSKKKVTFDISPTNSPELKSFSEKLEGESRKTIFVKIPEQLSQNSTPEFEASIYRNKENSVLLEHSKENRNSSTPEFNFEALKTIPSLISNQCKDNEKEKIPTASKYDVSSIECSNDNRSHEPQYEKSHFNFSQPTVNPLDCKSFTRNFETMMHFNQTSLQDATLGSKNNVEGNINHKSFASELQTAIIRPMQQLSLCSNNNLNETGAFAVRTEESIFTPHSLSFYSNSYLVNSISPPILTSRSSILNSYAPIRTPLVLKNIAENSELSPIRQRLDFEEVKLERRESQICLQNIPTIQKICDYLCDQECCMLSLLSSETIVLNRNLLNPIANILSNGDEMHFVPLNSSTDSDLPVEF